MVAKIGTNIEISLTIVDEGLVERFLKWFNEQADAEKEAGLGPDGPEYYKVHLDHNTSPYSADRADVYHCGLYHVAIPKPFVLGEKNSRNTLMIHAYQNIPVQMFAERMPELFKAWGITEWKERTPWYLDRVRNALDFIAQGGKQ